MTLKLLFWALMVIVNIKTGFYELIITRLHKRRHLTFIKHFSRSLSSCLTGPHTQSFHNLFISPRFHTKATSNDGELYDNEHGKSMEKFLIACRIKKTAWMSQISSQSLITVVFGQLKVQAFFQKYFLQIEFYQANFKTPLNESQKFQNLVPFDSC